MISFFRIHPFFPVFDFNLVKGNPDRLDEPNTGIISTSIASKYFKGEDPIGKNLQVTTTFTGELNVIIIGVAEDAPEESHFHFNILLSMPTLGDIGSYWSYHMFQTYVLLKEGQSAAELEKMLPSFAERFINHNTKADGAVNLFLQPIPDIHLHSNLVGEVETNSSITYVYVLSAIAAFILALACFNFMNLSTVHSLRRAKEIGLRKSVGAKHHQLIYQFLGEAALVTLFSAALALIIAQTVLPQVNTLFNRDLTLLTFLDPTIIGVTLFSLAIIAAATGMYPAFVLASFKPVEVLKGEFQNSMGGTMLRKSLVTFQFGIATILVASTFTLYKQLDFVKNKDTGFNQTASIVLTIPRGAEPAKISEFKNTLESQTAFLSVSASSNIPSAQIPINLVKAEGESESRSFEMLFVDADFIKTTGMTIMAGRDFSNESVSDEQEGFIINEEAAKVLGWTLQESVGKKFEWVLPEAVVKSGRIVGVVKDINFKPLRFKVQPMVMHIQPQRFQYWYVQVQPGATEERIRLLEVEFKKGFPAQPFEFAFLDETIQHLYDNERKLGSIFSYSSGLAIAIALLGILALSMHGARQRVKEVGIRKVLGASASQILALSVREFLILIVVSNVFAIPVAYYLINRWLSTYAYRTMIDWKVIIGSAMLVIVATIVTVSFEAVKSARSNPVNALRNE